MTIKAISNSVQFPTPVEVQQGNKKTGTEGSTGKADFKQQIAREAVLKGLLVAQKGNPAVTVDMTGDNSPAKVVTIGYDGNTPINVELGSNGAPKLPLPGNQTTNAVQVYELVQKAAPSTDAS